MNIEEQLLAASIRNTIHEADQATAKLTYVMHGSTSSNIDEGEHAEELREAERALAFQVEKVFRDTCILAERLGLPLFRRDIATARRKFKNLGEVEPTPDDIYFRSEPLAAARAMFNSLATMTNGREVTGLAVFENVLKSTPQIIGRAKLLPENEAAVRAAVREILGFGFTDVVREMPISKNLKTYKPDIGVRSLMAAAEYKFIDDAQEARNALDQVYADMKGYSGDPNWRSFYAVLYMTEPFFSQKHLDDEFRLVKADITWTPIVVVGAGGRGSKSQKAATGQK